MIYLIILSILSGLCLGLHESYDYGYASFGHMGFLTKWFMYRPITDKVFGKTLTAGKNFRELDLIFIALIFYPLSTLLQAGEYFIVFWIVRNTIATIVRDYFKFGKPFYSFKINLIF